MPLWHGPFCLALPELDGSARHQCVLLVVHQVAPLDGDLVGNVLGVVPDTPDEAGAAARLPRQAEEVHARLGGYTALLQRLSLVIEGVHLQPAVINGEPCSPDDRGNASSGKVQLTNGVGEALRIRPEEAGFRLLREVQAVALNVGVSFVEQFQVMGIAIRDVVSEVLCKAHGSVIERSSAPYQGDPILRERAEVDGVATVCATHRDGYVLRTHRRR
jgi:hypothetical protein